MAWTRAVPIRLRLALWYAGLLALLLAGSGLSIYFVHARAEYRNFDEELAAATLHVGSEVQHALDEGAPLGDALRQTIDITETGPAPPGTRVAVYDVAGRLVLGEPDTTLSAMVAESTGRTANTGDWYETVNRGEDRLRVYEVAIESNGMVAGYVQGSASLEEVDDSMARFRLLLILAGIFGIVAATAGGMLIASRALRPIADVTETARAIALSRGFERRLDPVDQQDELGELVRTFNQMLASLDAAYRTQRQFVDDAAHELRAPLTSIIGNLEYVDRAWNLPKEERREVTSDIREEAERLGRLVADLLVLARADSGQSIIPKPVDLDRVMIDALRNLHSLCAGVDLSIDRIEPSIIYGDADRLRQLVVILVENACRYTLAGGRVSLSLYRQANEACLIVADTGIGIPAEELSRVFDRFYRADAARSHIAGGSGLGLAIARWITEAHQGAITVRSEPGSGSTFTVTLPLAHQGEESPRSC